jgi:hypothetical protein
VTAAAGGQAQVFAAGEGVGKRPQTKEQNQEDGKSVPHLGLMVQDGRLFKELTRYGQLSSGYSAFRSTE